MITIIAKSNSLGAHYHARTADHLERQVRLDCGADRHRRTIARALFRPAGRSLAARRTFPAAHVLGCGTGGQISNNDINDEDISAAPRLGFYCDGEISPHAKSGKCELHNQTMTVTTLAEVA